MASTDTIQLTVITPERKVLECDATFVAFPAHDGEIGALSKRSPLVCKLGVGTLRAQTAEKEHVLMIDQGFAQIVDNRLTILTELAKKPEDIDRAVAEQSIVEARAMRITDDISYQNRDRAIRRAQVEIKLTSQGS